MRKVSLSKISIKLSSSFSKFINIFTAIVYLFTTVGSSLSHATNIITVSDPLEERIVSNQPHQRYDLSLRQRPEYDGIFFNFTNHAFPDNSLQSFVSLENLSSLPHFFPRLNKQEHNIGFKTTLPNFGTVYCDWKGNLSLVGIATQSDSTPTLSLTLTTKGYVSLSRMAFQDLSLHGSGARFIRGITIEGDSVFHVKSMNLMSTGFENKHTMRFLSKTRFLSKKQWLNSGTIFGEKDLDFNVFFHNESGEVSSNGLVKFVFNDNECVRIGHVSGKKVVLEDLSGSRLFKLEESTIEATENVTLIGNTPTMRGVSFITPALILDADSFAIGDQGNVEHTIVKRKKNQTFSLTTPYNTNGTLEFWQEGFSSEEDIQDLMLERFGDERGEMPAPEGLIDLQASIQAADGLKFFTPFAKVQLGDNDVEAHPEFILTNEDESACGNLTAYATIFDIPKGTLVAKEAFIHAPAGIKIGRLILDKTKTCVATFFLHGQSREFLIPRHISHVNCSLLGRVYSNVYDGRHLLDLPVMVPNSSFCLVKNQATFKGPLNHEGDSSFGSFILDTPKPSFITGSRISVENDALLLNNGKLTIQHAQAKVDFNYSGTPKQYTFVNSDPASLKIGGQFKESIKGLVLNLGSVFHAHSMDSNTIDVVSENMKTTIFQRIVPKGTYSNLARYIGAQGTITLMELLKRSSNPFGLMSLALMEEMKSGRALPSMVFLLSTGNFSGSQQVFPAQTSFGTAAVFSSGERRLELEGRFSAPIMVLRLGQGGARMTSMSVVHEQQRTQVQSLLPESFDLHRVSMAKNLRSLMTQQSDVRTFFSIRPRYFFDATYAHSFHAAILPYVRVQNRNGGFERPSHEQSLFSLSPSLLIDAVQKEALKTLKRGNIEDNRQIDEEQIIELHKNFVDYLEETQEENTASSRGREPTFDLALLTESGRPAPQKPFICYQSALNEEGIEELSPLIFIPKEMLPKSSIQTKIILTIPAGLSLQDWIHLAQTDFMLQETLEILRLKAPGVLQAIEGSSHNEAQQLALTGGETIGEIVPHSPHRLNSLSDFPMGDFEFNGDIDVDQFFALATGNIRNHGNIKCQDALLMSLLGNVEMTSKVTRIGNSHNFQDVILNPARVHAKGILRIFAAKNVAFQGAETISALGTHIVALADILDIPVQLVSQRIQYMTGKYEGLETFINVHNKTSSHQSGGEFTQKSQGRQAIHGAHYDADTLGIEAKKELTFASVYDHYIHTFEGKKSGFFKDKTIQGSERSSRASGCSFRSRSAPSRLTSHDESISLTAPNFIGGHGALLRAPNGRVEFLLGRNTLEVSYCGSSDGVLWQKNVQETESHLTFSLPTTDGGSIKVHAKETLLESVRGRQIAFLDNLDIEEGSLINQVIAELHDHHRDVIEGPGMALAIAVSVVVTCCTGGAGSTSILGSLPSTLSSTFGATVGNAIATGFTAAIRTGLTNCILDTFTAGGDVLEGVQKAVSGKRFRGVLTSGLSAGVSKYAGGKVSGLFEAREKLNFAGRFAHDLSLNATSKTVGASVKSLVQNSSFQGSFFDGLKTAVVNTVLETGCESLDLPSTDVLGNKDASAIEILGATTAKMVRTFASHSILSENPREALVKSIAEASATLAFHGVRGAFDAIMEGSQETQESLPPTIPTPHLSRIPSNAIDSINEDEEDLSSIGQSAREESFFGESGLPPKKPIFEFYDRGHHSDQRLLFENEVQDTPWDKMDEMLVSADFGFAYHNHYHFNYLKVFYQPETFAHKIFDFLSERSIATHAFAQRNPFVSSCFSTSVEFVGDSFSYATKMAASFFGDFAFIALDKFETKVGEAFNSGVKALNQYAVNLARDPVERMRYQDGLGFAVEGLGSVLVLANVRGLKGVKVSRIIPKDKMGVVKKWVNLNDGYHIRMNGSNPIVARNPGRAFDLPQMRHVNDEIVRIFDVKKATSRIDALSVSRIIPKDKMGVVKKWVNLNDGYHVRMNGFNPIVARNPGRAFDLPQMRHVNDEIVRIFDVKKATSRIHGCSNSFIGETHVYVIRDELGHVYKVGESMQGYTKLGLSKRAEVQAQKLRLETGQRFDTEVLHHFPNKRLAKARETRTIKVLRKRYGDKAVLGNKTNN